MKLFLTLWLTLGALPGFSENRPGAVAPVAAVTPEPAPQAPIALYTHFDQDPPQGIVEALHDELESIMDPMDLSFVWRSLDTVRGNEISTELAVVTFRGHCDVAGLTSRQDINPGALGWTHVSDGAILPFAEVDCDRIRTFVQKELIGIRAPDREDTLGRAIARVMAHELYHIFANTARHGSCGVGKAAYSVQELLTDEFQFEGRETKALRSSKAHSAIEIATHPPSTPPEP